WFAHAHFLRIENRNVGYEARHRSPSVPTPNTQAGRALSIQIARSIGIARFSRTRGRASVAQPSLNPSLKKLTGSAVSVLIPDFLGLREPDNILDATLAGRNSDPVARLSKKGVEGQSHVEAMVRHHSARPNARTDCGCR